MSEPSFDPIAALRQQQSRLIPGGHDKPFLEDPASFRGAGDPNELVRSEHKQHVPIPEPTRIPPVMDLADIIGSQEVADVQASGQVVFHVAGDTGNHTHSDLGDLVRKMALDYHRPNPADRPALHFHLGDVCYNLYNPTTHSAIPEPKTGLYQIQFYTPYANYPGKVIAIPGNHDTNPQEDKNSIDTFQANFCAPLPASAEELNARVNALTRQPMYQPGVYYRFDAPFVQVLALFSNGGEQAGVIREREGVPIGNHQWEFLIDQLNEIRQQRQAEPEKRRALILAVHHPSFSGGGGHSGSVQMLSDLDAAFSQAGILPDAVLSGHAHDYQRFTRTMPLGDGRQVEIPYVVAGNGGHGIQGLNPNQDGTPASTPLDEAPVPGDPGRVSLRQYFDGFGYLLVTVTPHVLTLDLIATAVTPSTLVDSVTLDLNAGKITSEAEPFTHPAPGEE